MIQIGLTFLIDIHWRQIKIAADDIFFIFYLYVSKKISLFSLTDNEKVFKNVVCCSSSSSNALRAKTLNSLKGIYTSQTYRYYSKKLGQRKKLLWSLTHCILVVCPTVICRMSSFIILEVSGLFDRFLFHF